MLWVVKILRGWEFDEMAGKLTATEKPIFYHLRRGSKLG
jgi:hypothetical protein